MRLFRTTTLHPNYTLRCYPEVGERVPSIGNCSEVMCHMRLDDKPVEVELKCSGAGFHMVQIWVDGREYSFPVTTGEGGFYCDYTRARYYTYADESRLRPEQLASIQSESEEATWLLSTRYTRNGECPSPGTPTTPEQVSSIESGPQG
jgi:hypothetical protein